MAALAFSICINILLAVSIIINISTTFAANITEILSPHPEYSEFNKYLSITKLADEINTRQTITILVLNNANTSTLISNHSLPTIKTALSLHILLDYYDNTKLHTISSRTALCTTVYQTTGKADGMTGFVNITDLQGGNVVFGSAVPFSPLNSSYVKTVYNQSPYNISVLEISCPIIVPNIMTDTPPSNITTVLRKNGCKRFSTLLFSTNVMQTLQTFMQKGLTVFAPDDGAFMDENLPDITKFSDTEMASLLKYHALPTYSPIGELKVTKNPISTLASTNGTRDFELTVWVSGDEVSLHSVFHSARVVATLIDEIPVVLVLVDNVLVPKELMLKAPLPAPGSGGDLGSPPPVVEISSPLAPPEEAPGSGGDLGSPPPPVETRSPLSPPAESPDNEAEDSKSVADVRSAAFFMRLVIGSVIAILFVLFS